MSKIITVLGIDPGINNTGLSFNKYNVETGELFVTNYYVLSANELARKENRQEARLFGNVFSLTLYERELTRIISDYKPDYVACEDAFYSPRTPNAFVSLKMCIGTIQRILYTHFHKELYRIPPKLAKSAVDKGTAGKVAVQRAIQSIDKITIKEVKSRPLDAMVEHEADAIAIAWTFVTHILPDLLLKSKK